MNKEEIKQYLRSQIDSCVKVKYDKNSYQLRYNKSYLRALKLSTITGKLVDKENFKGWDSIIWLNTESKKFWYFDIIDNYLTPNYTTNIDDKQKLVEEVINEYSEYKDYKYW